MRFKIFSVLASLVALWAFAAYVTVGEGVSLAWLATLEQQVAKPTEALIAAVQEERRASEEYLAAATRFGRSELDQARRATDAAIARQRKGWQTTPGRWSTSAASDARLGDLFTGLDALDATRAEIDAQRLDRRLANRYFTDLVQLGFDVYNTYTNLDDSKIIYQTYGLVLLTHSQEMISREDALLSGVIASGQFTEWDRRAFVELVGAQRYLSRQIAERFPQPDRSDYQALLAGQTMQSLRSLEDAVSAAAAGPPPVTDRAQWRTTATSAIDALRTLVVTLADRTVERVRPTAIWIIIRLFLAAGLGMVAVIASIRFTIRTLRSLQRQLAQLRVAAFDLAHERLPRVVQRLRRGEHVDVAEASPPLDFGSDDIGQVGQALNVVQDTAIRATVEQAELRRGVRDIFLSLAHRIQALVHRQLKLIDSMERQATTAQELSDLYHVDHLATRMRRHAENLIVLAGMPAGRTWRGAVPMIDVLRAALAEVEDYPRVRLRSVDSATLTGRAVADVIHVLAELVENATTFSPPHTEVFLTGREVQSGYLVEIEDRGLGLTPSGLDSANRTIADPPEFQLSSTARLGFFVVGRLASRYGIGVRLRSSPYQGITAAILIPEAMLGDGPETPEPVREAVPVAATASRAMPSAGGVQPQFTPAGLPWRVRRTRPAITEAATAEAAVPGAALTDATAPASPVRAEPPNGRTPEEVSRFVAAYVKAARKGQRLARPHEQ